MNKKKRDLYFQSKKMWHNRNITMILWNLRTILYELKNHGFADIPVMCSDGLDKTKNLVNKAFTRFLLKYRTINFTYWLPQQQLHKQL